MSHDQETSGTATPLAVATPWIDAHLAHAGIAQTGPFGETRVRPWAELTAIPTDAGTVWFKAASHATAHEIGLYPLLVAEAPDLVLHPIATDTERAWILLPDGGTSLMHAVAGDELVARLVDIMPRYATLQRKMAAHVPAMLAAGVPDMRPQYLAERFERALTAASALAADSAGDLDAMRRGATMKPMFETWRDALTTLPIAPSIDHSDLHANNMLLPDGVSGGARVYDWGDSSIGHPFSTLLVLLRSLMDQLETSPDDPRLARVRDAYLEPFSDVGGHAELVAIADAACWTSVVTRALVHVRIMEMTGSADPYLSNAAIEWMKTFLNPSWLE